MKTKEEILLEKKLDPLKFPKNNVTKRLSTVRVRKIGWKKTKLPTKKYHRKKSLTVTGATRGRKPHDYIYPPILEASDIPEEIRKSNPKIFNNYIDKVADHLDKVTDLIIKGLSLEKIAGVLGISPRSMYSYMKAFEPLRSAVELGREYKKLIDVEHVAGKLLRNASGYEYVETTVETNEIGSTTKVSTKYAKPNATSQIFYLKNKDPDVWADKKQIEVSQKLEEFFNE